MLVFYQILSPEICIRLQLGSLNHQVSGWDHYVVYFCDKNRYFIFVLVNLNPFSVTYLLIFFSPCCSFFSIVWIYFDLKHIMRSSMYRDPSIPDGNSLITLFIILLKRVTDNILPCGIPSFWFFHIWKCGVNANSEFFFLDRKPLK